MAGDSSLVDLFSEADVYVGDTDAVDPANSATAFGGTWDFVGLLDGSEGFVYAREEDKTDLFAWGGIIVRTTRKNFKTTVTFTALEDNAVTQDLAWPGSSSTTLVVPHPEQKKIAFERRDVAAGVTKRLITANYGEIDLDGDVTENEDTLAGKPFIATIFPDGDGNIWTVQATPQT